MSKSFGSRPALLKEAGDIMAGAVPIFPRSRPALIDFPRDASGATVIATATIGTVIGAALGGKDGAAVGALIGAGVGLAAVAVDNADSSPEKTKAATRMLGLGAQGVSKQPSSRTGKPAAPLWPAHNSARSRGSSSTKKKRKRRSASNI
jgi:hypothetical protein